MNRYVGERLVSHCGAYPSNRMNRVDVSVLAATGAVDERGRSDGRSPAGQLRSGAAPSFRRPVDQTRERSVDPSSSGGREETGAEACP